MTGADITARAVDRVVDAGILPEPVMRAVIRHLLRRRLAAAGARVSPAEQQDRKRHLLDELRRSPVALSADEANEQHYEVPTEFFELMLGPHLKYSSAYWPAGVTDLAGAEEAMLRLTCRRAGLTDGQDVLELGCGWGSLTLWMAARYPASRITAVSNSATQRTYIEKRARERDLDNVRVVTRDVNFLGAGDPPHGDGRETPAVGPDHFDRVVSVEMFEHVRNHAVLLRRIADWLRPGGRLFVHHFSHRTLAYPFDTGGGADWMARHFFTGGLMPSDDLLLHFADDLAVEDHWIVDGTHYARTLEAWLDHMRRHRPRILDLFADTYGPDRAAAWYERWKVFNLACAELFAFRGGTEWGVTHLRLHRPGDR